MSDKRAIQHVETQHSCDKNVFDNIKQPPPENCTSTESQALPCSVGKLQFRGGIDSERSTLVQLFSGTMHVLPQWRGHVAESPCCGELDRGVHWDQLTLYLSSALFFSATLSQICQCYVGVFEVLRCFFPPEFGCQCNFCEISHRLSNYAKWPETAASSPAVNVFQN